MASSWGWLLAQTALIALCIGAFLMIFYLTRQLREQAQQLDEMKGQVLEWNRRLEDKVAERTRELELAHRRLQDTYLETVTALVEAMSAKDTYLFGHSHNVATYARSIGEELGFSKERLDRLLHGCELHDLGKIAIPDSILMKKGPLTKEEFEVIKQHPIWGARILEPLTFMKDITEMVHQEHERWDGSGYPQGLRADRIRLEARIIAVADALDAMVSNRPYRESTDMDRACREIQRCAGTHFDPEVAEACLRAHKNGKLTALYNEQTHYTIKHSH